MELREIQEQLLPLFSLPKSSIIQQHFSAILATKISAKINSIPFPRQNINLQLQILSRPYKSLTKELEDDIFDRK